MSPARPAILLGAALLLAGLLFASSSLLVPALALLLIPLLLGAWARLAARGAWVRRGALPAKIVEGEPFELDLTFRSGLLPLVGSVVEPTLERPLKVRSLRPRRELVLARKGAVARRGRHRLPPPALRLADPLGFGAREISEGEQAVILALPRIEPILAPGAGGGGSSGLAGTGLGELALGTTRETLAEAELDGLRPYRDGTPASRIYWPALARGNTLIERRLARAGGTGPLIALDPSGAADRDALDRAVRAAASLCFQLGRHRGCELLLPGMRRRLELEPGMGSWPEVHAELALVEADQPPPRLRGATSGAPILWVSAGGTDVGAGGHPSGQGFLVTPALLPGLVVAFTVAGCQGYPLARGRAGAAGVAA